jgi:hypothetical protein
VGRNVLLAGGSAGQGPLGADCQVAMLMVASANVSVRGNVSVLSGSASSSSLHGSGICTPALCARVRRGLA